jgi:hypothetical protein
MMMFRADDLIHDFCTLKTDTPKREKRAIWPENGWPVATASYLQLTSQ